MAVEYQGKKIAMKVAVPLSKPTEEKIVDLAMADGNQVVTPSEGKNLLKVTINKPETMLPANIAKDVNIGGVVGTFEGGKPEQEKTVTINENGTTEITPDTGKVLSKVTVTAEISGGGEQPQLNAPTIVKSGKVVNMTNPATNGNFFSKFKVFANGVQKTEQTENSIDLSTIIDEYGTYTITVKCAGTNFEDSAASNSVEYVYSAQKTL